MGVGVREDEVFGLVEAARKEDKKKKSPPENHHWWRQTVVEKLSVRDVELYGDNEINSMVNDRVWTTYKMLHPRMLQFNRFNNYY